MTPRQIINRLRVKEDKLINAYEKKYATVAYKALIEQVEHYNSKGYINELPMYHALESLYLDTTIVFCKSQFKALDNFETKSFDLFLGVWDTWIRTWALTNLSAKVKEINDTTRRHIAEVVARGVNESYTFDTIADMIIDHFKGHIGRARAKMIARTEVGNAVNMGKEKSATDWESDSGIEVYKMWIHRFAKEPRGWHYMLDDNRGYPRNYKWSVTIPRTGITDLMDRPHDPSASAGNVVNCSCVCSYVSKRFAERLNNSK